jgi:hypothetical protein
MRKEKVYIMLCRLGERRRFGADWKMIVGNRLREDGSRQVADGTKWTPHGRS